MEAALCPAGAPRAVLLRGAAVWTAGSDTETGTAVLEASGGRAARLELRLSGGSRIEVRGLDRGAPRGASQATGMPGADGVAHARKLGDAWTPAAWFYPPLLLAGVGAGETAADLGPATLGGQTFEHLRIQRHVAGQNARMTAQIETLSQADLYLDPATLRPVRLRYLRHPGGNIRRGVPVEIRYGGWHAVQGAEIPDAVERWSNGTLQLTVTITAAQLNPPLDASQFVLEGAQ